MSVDVLLWGALAANVVLGGTCGYWVARLREATRRFDAATQIMLTLAVVEIDVDVAGTDSAGEEPRR